MEKYKIEFCKEMGLDYQNNGIYMMIEINNREYIKWLENKIKNLSERSEPPHPLLSDVDKLKKKLDTKDNQIEMLKEDIECVHMKLDDYGIPRELNDNTYSINGRINILIDLIKNENK